MSEVAKVKEEAAESTVNAVLEQLFARNTVTLPKLKKEVLIRKVTLRTMKPVTQFLGQIIGSLNLDEKNLPQIDVQDPATILKLISEHYDTVMDLVVKFTDLDTETLLDLELDESVSVVAGVIALNKDFFTKKVLPSVKTLMPEAAKAD